MIDALVRVKRLQVDASDGRVTVEKPIDITALIVASEAACWLLEQRTRPGDIEVAPIASKWVDLEQLAYQGETWTSAVNARRPVRVDRSVLLELRGVLESAVRLYSVL